MRTGSLAGAVSGRVDVVGTDLGFAGTRAIVGTDVPGAADAGGDVEGLVACGPDVDETAAPPGGSARSTDDDAQALANSKAQPTRYPPRHRTAQCCSTPTGRSSTRSQG